MVSKNKIKFRKSNHGLINRTKYLYLLGMILCLIMFIWAIYMAIYSYNNPIYTVTCTNLSGTESRQTNNLTIAQQWYEECNARSIPSKQKRMDKLIGERIKFNLTTYKLHDNTS